MGDKKKSYVVFVLDESSSMGGMRQEAIDAFNQQLEDIRKSTADTSIATRVGFIKFNSTVDDPILWDQCLHTIRDLEEKDYNPRGMTAMLDGVGLAIEKLNELEDINNDNTSVLLVVISDGMENNSKKFTQIDLAAKIKELQDSNKWTFTYSGANQDLSVVSQELNIPIGNTQSFVADRAGMKGATRGRRMSLGNYYTTMDCSLTGSVAVSDFYSGTATSKLEIKPDSSITDAGIVTTEATTSADISSD